MWPISLKASSRKSSTAYHIAEACIDEAVSFSGNDDASINTHFWQITDSTDRCSSYEIVANFNYTLPYNFNVLQTRNETPAVMWPNVRFEASRKSGSSAWVEHVWENLILQENTSLNDTSLCTSMVIDNVVFGLTIHHCLCSKQENIISSRKPQVSTSINDWRSANLELATVESLVPWIS
jgi:hypothetical protein